jgi:hypothetical protein
MPATRTYHHRPKTDPEDPTQCGVCGDPINRTTPTLHAGERPQTVPSDPRDMTTLAYAARLVRGQLAELPLYLTDEQLDLVARVAVEALYYRGGLKTRRSAWHPASGTHVQP